MGLLRSVSGDFFGLDIGTTAIRIVKIKSHEKLKSLETYAYSPIEPKLALSDSKVDQLKLAQAVKALVTKANMRTKNVAVGLPSQRVFTAVVDMEKLSNDELAKTIRFQADSLIPTPIAESKLDWKLIGESPADKNKVEVLLSSVANSYAEARLDLLESIGLNVIAFEPDSLALARALVTPDSTIPQMIIDMGQMSTDLVVIVDQSPRLTRSIPIGLDAIIRAAIQNLNIDEAQAIQFVSKFGLNQQKLEGQIFHAISGTVDLLIQEIDKSMKFFTTRYQNMKLEKFIVTGGASVLPDFPIYLSNKFATNVEIGNAWRNVSYTPDRQNELLAISNQFTVAVGLAERV